MGRRVSGEARGFRVRVRFCTQEEEERAFKMATVSVRLKVYKDEGNFVNVNINMHMNMNEEWLEKGPLLTGRFDPGEVHTAVRRLAPLQQSFWR